MDIINQNREKFEKSIEHFQNEIKNIRTGRATPSLVENIMVDFYGTKTPIIQLASISTPDPKSIVIQPWDSNATKEIEKAIQASNIGINPVNEGNILRLPIPPMTEERRKELVKVLHQKVESVKVSIKQTREEIWKELKNMEKEKTISEDDLFGQQKDLQKVIDKYNDSIQEQSESKEKEIMTI